MSLAFFSSRRSIASVVSKLFMLLMAIALAWSLGFNSPAALAADKAGDKEEEAKQPEPPEDIDLSTEDGMSLKATYFPGTKEKESIPVIILHGLDTNANRKEFVQAGGLAEFLQAQLGCTVIVPDLRGHGESIKTNNVKLAHQTGKRLQAMLQMQHAAMVEQDLRAVKDYLWKKNNDGKLNIDKLVVIGVESGGAAALGYADDDSNGYENHSAKYGPLQLGRFVKAIVIISPDIAKVTGLSAARALGNPVISKDINFLILSGNQSKSFAEATSLKARLVNARPKPEPGAKAADLSVWFYSKIETKLQGTKLLGETSLAIPDKIKDFITARIVKNPEAKDWGWKERKLPHQ